MTRMRTELYRHYDKHGILLYVGVSISACARLITHRSTASWFDEITTIKVERFDTREEALDAEHEAIVTERPLYNQTCSPKKVVPMIAKTLSAAQICRRAKLKPHTFYNMVRDGRFPVEPLPRTRPRRWSVDAVDAWLAGQG